MSDPLLRPVEQNWLEFKTAICETVSKHVPHKIVWSHNHLPWINRQIKKDMKTHKHLYKKAKRTNSNTDWYNYRQMKNLVSGKLKAAHNSYFSIASFDGNRHQFWKYIRAKRKDNNEIPTLKVNGQCISDSKSKATVLNNYFKSVFTNEDLSHIPSMDGSGSPLPSIPNVTFTVPGIQYHLSTLDANKASGPDYISPYIL